MGYRSEVRCLIYGTKEQMDVFLTTQALVLNSPALQEFKKDLIRYEIKLREETLHVLDLDGSDWKWYQGAKWVEAWNSFMEAAEEDDLQYEFICIGEDPRDIEQDTSADYIGLLHVLHPSIAEDFDKGEKLPLGF